jgi:hypothetical protein
MSPKIDLKLATHNLKLKTLAMSWHESVLNAIQRVTARTGHRVFSRQELIASELGQILAETDPGSGTPEQTLNRVLQELRIKGTLELESPDIYRLLR